MKKESAWFALEHGDKLVIYSDGKQYFRFRQDPVPGHRWVWKNGPRHYRTVGELRAYCDRDLGRHARAGRRRELRTVFEVCRVSEKSWKSHGKRRHQWMKKNGAD